jgi:hypothetical protein
MPFSPFVISAYYVFNLGLAINMITRHREPLNPILFLFISVREGAKPLPHRPKTKWSRAQSCKALAKANNWLMNCNYAHFADAPLQ